MFAVRKLAFALVTLAPAAAFATGGHDAVGCGGCHSLHAARGEHIFAVQPNTKYLNPKTKQPYGGSTGLCLACHQDSDKGGQGFAPVSQHNSHPFGIAQVNAKVAKVPAEVEQETRRLPILGQPPSCCATAASSASAATTRTRRTPTTSTCASTRRAARRWTSSARSATP